MKDEKFEKLVGQPRVKKDVHKMSGDNDLDEAELEKKRKEKKEKE